MKGIDHCDEVLVWYVAHDAVATAGDPTSPGLEDFHVLAEAALHVGRSF